jgi:alkanesulfonate monooxygenase SsuD/methylene tetrahydromethanopterin reductase-like flavin-dependent oxidoreductase (luciferase family)
MSSLHRNPGITAKAAATIDEISGGRFVLGLGAGHAGSGAHAFGMPEDHVYDRFEEAIEIVVPLLRIGRADQAGIYHVARDLEQLPAGPRPTGIPILLAGHGPKGYRHAARVADIWSCYAEEGSEVAELGPRVAAFEAACVEVGRDPSTIGRSAGVVVAPLEAAGATGMFGRMVGGSTHEIADAFRSFRAAGFTQLEFMLHPQSAAALEAMAPVLELLDND